MKIKKQTIFLLCVIFLAAFLRLYKLGGIPPHLTPDEASLGYNAYSILQTGRDEYGELMPIIFKSFGDWKPGLYVYLSVPFIFLFGLTEFSVRFVGALGGIMAVWLIYLVMGQVIKTSKIKNKDFYKVLPLISSFLLAISPWHIHFSRGAWESNMSLTLTLAGLYFFFRFLEKNWNLIPASFFFALTFLTYQGAKLSTIIVIFLLVFFYRKKLWTLFKADKKMVSIAFCLGLVVSLPAILSLITGKTGRLAVFSIFSYPRPPEYLNAFLKKGNVIPGSFDYYFFYSEGFNFLRGILGRWFNHFSTRFLFFEGDWQNPRHSIPYHGQLLLATILPLIYGLYLNLKRAKKLHWFFLSWLFLSPFPAVLSRDQVQAVRSLPMVIPLVVVSSYGVLVILKKFGKAGAFSLATLYIVSFAYFLDSYFVHLTPKNANYWYYGYKQVFEKYSKAEKKKIIVEQSYDQPYIYYLFYTGYDPARYQEKAHLVQTGSDVGQVGTAGDIRFLQFGWPAAREKQVLYIGKAVTIPKEVGEGFRLLDEIHYPNGEAAFRVVESLP